MLKKLSATAVILAMSAMLLVPTAYAVQSVDAPAQKEENCIKTLLELLAGDTEKRIRREGRPEKSVPEKRF